MLYWNDSYVLRKANFDDLALLVIKVVTTVSKQARIKV